jgi:hypothetical protein
MSNVNKLTVSKQYVQSGGFMMIIAKIGEFLLVIVMAVINFFIAMFKTLFMIRFDDQSPLTLFLTIDSGEGMFFKYIWFSIKCGFYLVVFAFGGPLLALLGIVFLYKNLFSKLSELKEEEEDKDKDKDQGGEEEGE